MLAVQFPPSQDITSEIAALPVSCVNRRSYCEYEQIRTAVRSFVNRETRQSVALVFY